MSASGPSVPLVLLSGFAIACYQAIYSTSFINKGHRDNVECVFSQSRNHNEISVSCELSPRVIPSLQLKLRKRN